jgi:hypothetical protein
VWQESIGTRSNWHDCTLECADERKRSTISPDDLLHRGAPSIAPTLIAQARYLPVALPATSPPFCLLRITSVLTQQDRLPRRNHNLGMLH